MEGKKIYIAGKITGFPQYKEKFQSAEHMLGDIWGMSPMNPARLPQGFSWDEYMHICFSMIDVCEYVFFLNNWKESQGAIKEYEYAVKKGKKILFEEVRELRKSNTDFLNSLLDEVIVRITKALPATENKIFLKFWILRTRLAAQISKKILNFQRKKRLKWK